MSCRPVHGTTDVMVKITEREQGIKYEIRMGWEYPGICRTYSLTDDPFDPEFYDNVIIAKGYRLKAAWNSFKEQMNDLADTYWV